MSVDKLVDSTQLNSDLTSIANAIRTRGGTSAQLAFPAGFVGAIAAIPSGGGGSLKYEIGSFTLANDANNTIVAIPHTLGEAPDVVFVWPDITGTSGAQRGYIYLKAPIGETTQYTSSTGKSNYPVSAHYYISDVGPPLKTRVTVPSAPSYLVDTSTVPTSSNIYLIRFASSWTWYAGTYKYFISEKWW